MTETLEENPVEVSLNQAVDLMQQYGICRCRIPNFLIQYAFWLAYNQECESPQEAVAAMEDCFGTVKDRFAQHGHH